METMRMRKAERQRGFTLIELLAVMAILAVLVSIVAPAVSGTKDASVKSQTLQDANQVRTGGNNFFSAQNEAEVRTPHSVTLTTKINSITLTSTEQEISSKWPEKFITTGNATNFPAIYASVFPTSISTTNGVVVNVNLKDKEGNPLTGITLLTDFTAIDLDRLLARKLLSKKPPGTELNSSLGVGALTAPSFLWLFEKTDSSADRQNDSREIAVFQLSKVEKNEAAVAGQLSSTVDLSYERIF